MLETFKKAGIRFYFGCRTVVPEIPSMQDVLFALRLSDTQEYYEFCVGNDSTYVVNVGLVIAAVGSKVLNMERYDEVRAKKIIARAIIELSPEAAKLHGNRNYIEAQEILGEEPDHACQVYCPACSPPVYSFD